MESRLATFERICARRKLWVAILLPLALAGCSRRDYDGPRRFPLAGKVTIDGEPVDFGSISFLPASEGGGRVSGGLIEKGSYAVPEEQGANAGKHRVEIRWRKLTGKKVRDPDSGEMYDERKEGLPTRFHAESELTAEVSAEQTTFDFDLKSK
jgi:hypothetical protein